MRAVTSAYYECEIPVTKEQVTKVRPDILVIDSDGVGESVRGAWDVFLASMGRELRAARR